MGRSLGRFGPKLTALVDLIDEHRDAFAYDWRARFGMSIEDTLAVRVSWAESLSLFRVLVSDPSSNVAAAVHGMLHPFSREAFILADAYDLTLSANWSGKGSAPKPYPRPTDSKASAGRLGDTSKFTQAEVRALLASRGPQQTPPPTGRPRDARGRFISTK